MDKHWPLTKSEMEAYVGQLDPQMQRIYRECQDLLLSFEDTLEDDFQICGRD